jgi:hypothetical protein
MSLIRGPILGSRRVDHRADRAKGINFHHRKVTTFLRFALLAYVCQNTEACGGSEGGRIQDSSNQAAALPSCSKARNGPDWLSTHIAACHAAKSSARIGAKWAAPASPPIYRLDPIRRHNDCQDLPNMFIALQTPFIGLSSSAEFPSSRSGATWRFLL